MSQTATINPRIVEALYGEALVLSDEVRATFALTGRIGLAGADDDLARVALSCEGLRTTTRMMHAVAWLLNYRAYLLGDLSEFQLRRQGRLTPVASPGDADNTSLLPAPVRELVAATERFYARLLRLDSGWRDQARPGAPGGPAISRLRARMSLGVAH